MGIFTKFKLISILTIFSYVANTISINKLQNLKTIKYFANSINYYNFLNNRVQYNILGKENIK